MYMKSVTWAERDPWYDIYICFKVSEIGQVALPKKSSVPKNRVILHAARKIFIYLLTSKDKAIVCSSHKDLGIQQYLKWA